MGCWIETDMLTNLPIDYGEHTAAVLIAQECDPKHTCYPNETWTPISPLIYGTYDDYGRIEGYDKSTERLFLDVFREAEKKNIRLMEKGEGGEESTFLDPGTSLKDVIEVAADGKLFLRTHENCRVALALLKPAYVERCKTFPDAKYVYQTFADMEAMQTERTAKLRTLQETITDEAARAEVEKLCDTINRDLPAGALDPHHPMLKLFYKAGADIATIFCINIALHTLRSEWRPTSGAGGQTGIECPAVVYWYRAIAEDANNAYCEYEYQVQCRNEEELEMAEAFDTDE